jgi:DNA-binding Xre family transcriptional regulator
MTEHELLRNNLKRLLEEKGWSVKIFSEKSGLSERTIQNIIKAKHKKIHFRTLYIICTTLQTTMKELAGF